MADMENGTLAGILNNLRTAAVQFGDRFSDPARIRPELVALLGELGINDPQGDVSRAMETAAATWAGITDPLKALNFNFLDPVAAVDGLAKLAGTITDKLAQLAQLPASTLAALSARGNAIQQVLPKRLLGYLVFELLTHTHRKIAGAFLLLGVLRRPFTPANGNPIFVNAHVRVFDVKQLVRVFTHPREALLEALQWGTDDFDSQTVIDGVSLLIGLVDPNGVVLGPVDDRFPPANEAAFVGRSEAELGALKVPSARRTLKVPSAITSSLVGLHRDGLGLMAPNPVHIDASLGGLHLPGLGPGKVLALSAGTPPATADPRVRLLP